MLTKLQVNTLKKLMIFSAQKGNLANAAMVLEANKELASAESWVVSSCDATAHSERMLVAHICHQRHTNWTPDLTMVSVIEPCLMCLSACSQAGYKELQYIIPAKKYVKRIPWMTDTTILNKHKIAKKFSNRIKLTHLLGFEKDFCKVFESAMTKRLA